MGRELSLGLDCSPAPTGERRLPPPAAPQRPAASHPAPFLVSSLKLTPVKSLGGNSINILPPNHLSAPETQGKKNVRATPGDLRAGAPNRTANTAPLYKHVSSPRTSVPAPHVCLTTTSDLRDYCPRFADKETDILQLGSRETRSQP